jgi:glucan-binding YG repeat protein
MEKNYWQRNNIGWYYINSDGVLMNCESKIDGSTYRFNSDGYMITGWYYENNAWYYYYLSGQKAYNTIIDGQYWLDSKGKWIS